MVQLDLNTQGRSKTEIEKWLDAVFTKFDKDSVIKIKVHGKLDEETLKLFRAESVRTLAPPTMNVSIVLMEYRK